MERNRVLSLYQQHTYALSAINHNPSMLQPMWRSTNPAWWESATDRDIVAAIELAHQVPHDPQAAAVLTQADAYLQEHYGITLQEYYASIRDIEQSQSNIDRGSALDLEQERDSELSKAEELYSEGYEQEANQHYANAEEAHAEAGRLWDSAEARQTRSSYYDSQLDMESARSAKLTDVCFSRPPRECLNASSRGLKPSTAARVLQPHRVLSPQRNLG